MNKKNSAFLSLCPSFFTLLFLLFTLHAFLLADINTGIDIRGRGYRTSTPFYGTPRETARNFFEQRTKFYLEGHLKKDVGGEIKLQNFGIWGREDESEFFLETANISVKNTFGAVKIGRQNFMLNDGLLINDNENGLDGVTLETKLPFGFKANGAALKLVESSTQNFSGGAADKDVYLISLKKNFSGKNIFINYLADIDKSSDTKNHSLIGLRYESALVKELQWTVEIAKTAGSKKFSDALAYFMRINAFGDIAKIGKGGGFFLFASGSGDDESTTVCEGFHPAVSFISESAGFGEYYMKNRGEGLDNSIENLQIIGGGLSCSPKKYLNILFNYFSYALMEKNDTGETALGKEFDLGAEYSYTENLGFRFVFSRFAPGAATATSGSSVRQILFETNLTF
ncbi:MAG: alginate export family protein [bacterium]